MLAWSQLDFSAIPVSISAVSLTSRQTWKNVNSKRRLQRIQNVQEEKRHKKKRHLAVFIFVPSVFGEKLPTDEFWMISADIERNSQMFNEEFYLPLYLPLCSTVSDLLILILDTNTQAVFYISKKLIASCDLAITLEIWKTVFLYVPIKSNNTALKDKMQWKKGRVMKMPDT
jgi:hypothetical protein